MYKILPLLICFLLTRANETDNLWRAAGRATGLLIRNCIGHNTNGSQNLLILQQCFLHRSFLVFDETLNSDVIRLGAGIELVRSDKDHDRVRSFDWKNNFIRRLIHVLDTHTLKINVNQFTAEERGRRRKPNMMLALLLFKVAAVGLIMVPLAFQFLAVLGGKALLLAKMALILTAIQGLKKIATSQFNYGLYTESEYPHGPWYYDRKWPYDPEHHDYHASHIYNTPESQRDVMYPYQPREDSFPNIM